MRWFGLVMTAVFGVLGSLIAWRLGAWGVARGLWITGVGVGLLYYAVPPLRLPLLLGWMALVTPIGLLISRLLLAGVYFGLITPMALVMRLFRQDQLTRRFEPEAPSYWSAHDPGGDPARYFRQS